jgi:hypothetical protein
MSGFQEFQTLKDALNVTALIGIRRELDQLKRRM